MRKNVPNKLLETEFHFRTFPEMTVCLSTFEMSSPLLRNDIQLLLERAIELSRKMIHSTTSDEERECLSEA